jgi:hypothetical protein
MSIETPKEHPNAKAIEAAKQALAAEAPTNPLARQMLDQLSATIEPDAMRQAITTVQASPDYQTLSEATRSRLDALWTSVPADSVQPAVSVTGQVADLAGKTWNSLPWYGQMAAAVLGVNLTQRMLGGAKSGAKAVGSWTGDQLGKIWGFLKWSAKAVAIAGTGILAGIGIKSVYDGSKEGKTKTA